MWSKKYENILEPGHIFWDKEQATKRIVKSEKIKSNIFNNINLRNSQNYILSYNRIENTLWVYNHPKGSRGSNFKFNSLDKNKLYFLNNLDLNKANKIISWEKSTILFYMFFVSFIWLIAIFYSDFNYLLILFFLFIFLLFYYFVFFYSKKWYRQKNFYYSRKKKIYFFLDKEWIYYHI